MTDYCEFCGQPVGPGLGKIPGQCPVPRHGTHHAGTCCEQLSRPKNTVSREQQHELDPILGGAVAAYGPAAGDLIMAAYNLGREHGTGVSAAFRAQARQLMDANDELLRRLADS